MKEDSLLFDVCIVCALYEEAKAVLDEFSNRCNVSFTKGYTLLDHYVYQHTTILNNYGESLTILVTWPADKGPVKMALAIKPFLYEFRPRFVAMSGICAVYRRKLKLCDLVVAKSAYHYGEGKFIKELNGQTTHLIEALTFQPSSQVIQYANGFNGWIESVREIKCKMLRRSLKPSEEPHCVIEPMASGMAVHSDDPLPLLREKYNRNTVALDMEAAAFYSALNEVPNVQGLVVKGVCYYEDMI